MRDKDNTSEIIKRKSSVSKAFVWFHFTGADHHMLPAMALYPIRKYFPAIAEMKAAMSAEADEKDE
jgi:predicted esterase